MTDDNNTTLPTRAAALREYLLMNRSKIPTMPMLVLGACLQRLGQSGRGSRSDLVKRLKEQLGDDDATR
jgi:hypothetical protein